MNISFFGLHGSLEYYRIGGSESFTRRVAFGLERLGHQTDYIMYGAPYAKHKKVTQNIELHYVKELPEAFRLMAGKKKYDHILTIYLPPRDRLRYLYFRHQQRHKLHIHQIYFSWPESPLKRRAAFLDARLYPFNGRLFCISPGQFRYVSQWSARSTLIFPPVAENYFLEPDTKPNDEKIRVTYIGRTESGKGIEEVIKLFSLLKTYSTIELAIHGFHHKTLPDSVKIHEWLSQQQEIPYFYKPFESYSPAVEDNLRLVLKNTDILVLPYRRLSSTIATPLLLLEGMASLCGVLTRKAGDIPEIYGPSPLLLDESDDITMMAGLIKDAPRFLDEERRRIYYQNQKLEFDLKHTVEHLLLALN